MSPESFSKRNRYAPKRSEGAVRNVAPSYLRYLLLDAARRHGLQPAQLRAAVCDALRKVPVHQNTGGAAMMREAETRLAGSAWFRIYDVAEELYRALYKFTGSGEQDFKEEINRCLEKDDIGWRFNDAGEIVAHGTEAFQATLAGATAALNESGRPNATRELQEALAALSRRPDPNLRGAVFHSMGALECLARDLVGDPKATLGELLKKYPGLLPEPLGAALTRLWGYASDRVRHVEEGSDPSQEEAELVVGLASALATYLVRTNPAGDQRN